jgi:hypothetical protein
MFSKVWSWLKSWFTKDNLAEAAKDLQDATVTACGFLPTAETAAAVLVSVDKQPTVSVVMMIAEGICNIVTKPTEGAVTQMGLMSEPVMPTFNGVKIEGEFVK